MLQPTGERNSDFESVRNGYDTNPPKSFSLKKEAYVDPRWHDVDVNAGNSLNTAYDVSAATVKVHQKRSCTD